MVVHFPQAMSSARPSSSNLLSSPVRQPTSAPYLAQLQQLNIGLSMVPEILAPGSRPTSPAASARIDKLRQQIVHDVFTRKLLVAGNYPRLTCTSLRGPFEDSGAEWGQARDNPSLAADRQWSPLPADDLEALTSQDNRRKSNSLTGNAITGQAGSQALPTAPSMRNAKESSSSKRSPTHTSDARSVHTGMVTPPVSSGEDADPIQRNAPRPVSFTGQSQPGFDDLLHVDDDLFANDEAFAPLATSTQLHHVEGSPGFAEPLLPSPSSPSSFHHAHSSSQPEPGRATASPSPLKHPRLSALQPNTSPPRPHISDMQSTTPSKKRRIMEAVELPITPRTRRTSDLPITPVSVPAHARQPSSSSARGLMRDNSPSPVPKARRYDGIPEFSELVMRSAAKKRRKRPSVAATPIAIAVAQASGPSQPENRSNTSNNSMSSYAAGFGQQDMEMDFVYTGKLGDIAPSQALPASEGDGLSQPDFAMASSSQSVEIGGAGVSKSVEKRVQRVGRFLQSDAWEF